MPSRASFALSLVVFALLASAAGSGCGGDGGTRSEGDRVTTATPARTPRTAGTAPSPAPAPAAIDLPACPPGLANCRSASGRVVYVEGVDADGDGDAHFVLTSEQSITAPGLTVVDVKPALRPDPLPEEGDEMAAAGPVYRGSYGQRQIEAIEVRVARR